MVHTGGGDSQERSQAPTLPPLLSEEQEAFSCEKYVEYFRAKRGNFFLNLKVFRGVWDCLQLLSQIWEREMSDLETVVDENHMLPKMLFMAAHARFLMATELGFSCCIDDAYSILRDGIEFISHAYKLIHEPGLIPTWINKNHSKADKKAYDRIFTHDKKVNLYPDKDGMNYLHTHYGRFSEMATHPSTASLAYAFTDASTATNRRWIYHYFQNDENSLAVFLLAFLQVCALMEQAFFACFEPRLKLDPYLEQMRMRFSQQKDAQRQFLDAKCKQALVSAANRMASPPDRIP